MAWCWVGAGAMLVLAVLAGIGDWQRKRRRDLDRIGIVDWPTVQMLALLLAVLFAIIACDL